MSADKYVTMRDAAALEQVSLGYRTVRLIPSAELAAAQDGYGDDAWATDWLVIATEDELGDPIFTDVSTDVLPVFTAAHGAEGWEPVQIADSFDRFVAALTEVASVSSGREHPVGLEDNPLTDDERDRVLGRIEDANPDSDTEFWASWLEA